MYQHEFVLTRAMARTRSYRRTATQMCVAAHRVLEIALRIRETKPTGRGLLAETSNQDDHPPETQSCLGGSEVNEDKLLHAEAQSHGSWLRESEAVR